MKPGNASPRLLVITRQSPFPGGGGSGEYFFDILKYLGEEGVKIDCVWTTPGLDQNNGLIIVSRKFQELIRLHIDGFWSFGPVFFSPQRFFKQLINKVLRKTNVEQGLPSWNEKATEAEGRIVGEYCEKIKPDAILANYFWMAEVFNTVEATRHCLKLVVTHEVWNEKVAAFDQKQIKMRYSPVSAELEAGLLEAADVVLAISDTDAASFRALLPKTEIITAPMSTRVDATRNSTVRGRCLFVGSGYKANVDGLRWFLSEVWPKVLSLTPLAHLHVCGTVCNSIEGSFVGVRFLGRLKSLDSEYHEAETVIVPLRVGAGVKIKLVEALGHGKAIVSTSTGLLGLDFLKEPAVVQADDPKEFANKVARILRDPEWRQKIEASALQAAHDNLSAEKCYRPLLERLRQSAQSSEGTP